MPSFSHGAGQQFPAFSFGISSFRFLLPTVSVKSSLMKSLVSLRSFVCFKIPCQSFQRSCLAMMGLGRSPPPYPNAFKRLTYSVTVLKRLQSKKLTVSYYLLIKPFVFLLFFLYFLPFISFQKCMFVVFNPKMYNLLT